MHTRPLAIAGGGMAGLVAAARLRELGVRAVVHEKGSRLGGSMLLSSCVIWRHREWSDFRRECPAGDPALQHLIWSRLDSALEWLAAQGAGADLGRDGESAHDRMAVRPRRAHAVAGGPRRRRQARRAVDPGVGPTDPVHRWLRRLVRARVSSHPSDRAPAAAREPLVAGRRPARGNRARRRVERRARRVLRPQHARRAVGRVGVRVALAALRPLRSHLRRDRRRVLLA